MGIKIERERGGIRWKDQTSPFILLLRPRETTVDHKHIFYFSVIVLTACEFLWRFNESSNERGRVLVLVMIAMSYVKMSSCPRVPTSRVDIPPSDTQQATLSVEVEDRWWKVQADVCVSVFLCPISQFPLYLLFFFLLLHSFI